MRKRVRGLTLAASGYEVRAGQAGPAGESAAHTRLSAAALLVILFAAGLSGHGCARGGRNVSPDASHSGELKRPRVAAENGWLRPSWTYEPPRHRDAPNVPGVLSALTYRNIAVSADWLVFPREGESLRQQVLVCLAADDGHVLWSRTEEDVLLARSGELVLLLPSVPVQDRGAHFLTVLDGASGRPRGRISIPSTNTYNDLSCSTDRAYLETSDGQVECFDLETGELLWHWSIPPPVGDWGIEVVPADGAVFVVNEYRAYSLDEHGHLLWARGIDPQIECTPHLTQTFRDSLLVVGYKGALAVDAASGDSLWERNELPGVRQAGIASSDRLLLLATRDQLIALALDDGTTHSTQAIATEGMPSSGTSLVVARGFVFLYPLQADRNWHLHAIPLAEDAPGLRDPVPFKIGLPIARNDRYLYAFDVSQVRAYDLVALPACRPTSAPAMDR